MKKIFPILLGLALLFVLGCQTESSDDSKKTSGGSGNSDSQSTSLTITYTSIQPDDVYTTTGGWLDCSAKYYSADGLYPSDVPSAKSVTATSEAAGYSASYTLTASDLPELSHEFLTFAGWYNGDTKMEVGDSIYADTTLNALWQDGKKTGAIVYKKADKDVVSGSTNIFGSAYTYSGNYNANYGTPVGILVVSVYSLSSTESYFIMNPNESSEKLVWATEDSTPTTIIYRDLLDNGTSTQSYGSRAYSYLTSSPYNVKEDTIPAIKYCNDLTDNGLTWFLPSLSEINGLTYDYFDLINNSLEALNTNGIPATKLTTDGSEAEDSSDGVYWTSSVSGTNATVAQAWNLFMSGTAMKWLDCKTGAHRVRAFAAVDENFAN